MGRLTENKEIVNSILKKNKGYSYIGKLSRDRTSAVLDYTLHIGVKTKEIGEYGIMTKNFDECNLTKIKFLVYDDDMYGVHKLMKFISASYVDSDMFDKELYDWLKHIVYEYLIGHNILKPSTFVCIEYMCVSDEQKSKTMWLK